MTKLAVIGEPPESTEPLSFAALELDRLFTTAITVDQTTGLPSSGNVYLDNVHSVAAFNASGTARGVRWPTPGRIVRVASLSMSAAAVIR